MLRVGSFTHVFDRADGNYQDSEDDQVDDNDDMDDSDSHHSPSASPPPRRRRALLNYFVKSDDDASTTPSPSPSRRKARPSNRAAASNKNRHPCPVCSMTFVRQHDVYRHVRYCHEGNLEPCRMCGKPFSRNDARKRHEDNSCPAKRRISKQYQHEKTVKGRRKVRERHLRK
jgi:uncharacterized Zn-finger protein